MDSYAKLLQRLAEHRVEFVVIGGYAIVLHGALLLTADVDICIPFELENLKKLVEALKGLHPVFRFHIKEIPLHEDAEPLTAFKKSIYLKTDWALLDILGFVEGVGGFPQVAAKSISVPFFGQEIKILDIDGLLAAKTAAGRDKDRSGIYHLEAIKRERERHLEEGHPRGNVP